jgi:serine/threonine-protein kinase
MGTVYEASDAAAGDAPVALKTLFAPPDSRQHEQHDQHEQRAQHERHERRARFLREAAVCATIRHPHVVPVIDHGVDAADDVPFLVMPLLAGEDLATVLDRVGCLEPEVAVALAVQACEGLAAVHARGVVHRDVKPSNLFLERASAGGGGAGSELLVVKVTDFGLAKAYDHPGASSRAALTATGRFMGTPQYVSPEQAISAKHVDFRSDVFSLAMSLYHALSGAPAFSYVRSFMGLVLELTGRESPPLQDAAPWVPPDVARIVHSALLRDRDLRCPSVTEFALALDMAMGIDASRAAVKTFALRPLSDFRRQKVAPRALPPSSWSEVLRV